MGVLDKADRRPVMIPLIVLVMTSLGLAAWSHLSDQPVLLARADGEQRRAIYSQLNSSSIGMLGISLTVLAILTALPDRGGVMEMRNRPAWPLLQGGLLATAGLCLLLLVATHIAIAVDHARRGHELVGGAVVALAGASLVAVLVFGTAFWLALRRARDPQDPADARSRCPA